ncbi:bifunctional deaminase-reductase domain-containing protein [Natrialba hulunbeirensis JCM 10989]|uniref:Bifunctional deaminase-reductase domain-containing protein n=1 Tax=Natrialba hulunbeirensis JCM 10989 TaxID=1227493 RepID=L9ZJM3_9EURY|nr:dihydrofolate reductase family protein [Natrialba hulunbeirensis]ELY86524.1 bifunctional deaminase-reductase domain-containing protein [Natrialba hulunbeirensis JCM 10989]
MTDCILYIATSVDGYIATDDGSVSWLEEIADAGADGSTDDPTATENTEPTNGGYDAFFASVDCLVMGSTTYEQVLDFGAWPYEDRLTYVLTSRELPLATDAVELVDDDPAALVERLKRHHDRIWLVGGATIAQSLLRANAVDELRLTLAPILLGSGISLFGDSEAGTRHALELLETTPRETGLVELRYRIGATGER